MIRLIQTDFEGNLVNSAEVPNQIRLDFADYEAVLNALPPEATGIDTQAVLLNFQLKLYEDTIYFCGTIARKGVIDGKYTGVLLCMDRSGNVLWRKDKTDVYWAGQSVDNISRYNDFYIDKETIYVVGAEGRYGYDDDLPDEEKGTRLVPVMDEYTLDGELIASDVYDNDIHSSQFDRILKTPDGFLLLGRPRLEETMGGQSDRQTQERNGLIFEAIIQDDIDTSAQTMDDHIIGSVIDYDTLVSTPKIYKDYQQYLQVSAFLSFLRDVNRYQAGILVFLSITALAGFFPILKKPFAKRWNQENDA